MKFLTLKLKITILFLLLITSMLVGGYFYLNTMSVVSGNINVNKTNPIDKLCNYSVYSDFYYRIVDYSNEIENSYAELTPVRTTICYNFKNNKINLQSSIEDESTIILDDTHGNNIEKKIDLLENFKKTYSKIITTQDKDYFEKSSELAKQTLLSLYGKNKISIKKINPQKEYYRKIDNLPIDNMVVEHFKLEQITIPIVQATKDSGWQPNILEWTFEEKDRIYLQYLEKFSNTDLDEYIKSEYSKSNKVIVKLTKFNNNTLNKMFLIFDDKQKKIKTLFMDNNGYIYTLILQVSNKKSFETYFNDYMKIAYGIFFIKKDKLNTSFMEEQKEVDYAYKAYITNYKKMLKSYNKLLEYKCTNLLNHYTETKSINNFVASDNKIEKMNHALFDKRYKMFKEIYGTYPNKKILNSLVNDTKNIELINEAVYELKPLTAMFGDKYKEGSKILKEKCPDSIECIKKLKNKNWEDN